MPPVLTDTIAIDLAELEAHVGSASFKRGKTYARAGRVMRAAWDEQAAELRGRVVGNGAIYDTGVSLRRVDGELTFVEGECSCPVGWNCKHVAALVLAASPSGALARARPQARPAPAAAASPAVADPGPAPAHRGPAGADAPAERQVADWEAPLRALVPGVSASAAGEPLAIELAIVFNGSASSPGAPRLQARLMRPGARGGWINGSLSWAALDPWDLRGGGYREDHLQLARDFQLARQASRTQRYYYPSSRDRVLDLSDFESFQLWPLLDRAAAAGMLTIRGGGRAGDVPRYRHAELVLDVTAATGGGLCVTPALSPHSGAADLSGYAPLLFLGGSGHGLVMVSTIADAAGGPLAADLTTLELRLLRLARETPPQLQRMLLEGTGLTIPASDVDRFAREVAPALRGTAPLVSSDGAFTLPEISPPALVLSVVYGEGHLASVAWAFTYTVAGERVDVPVRRDGAGIRDPEAERLLLDSADLPAADALRELGLLTVDNRPSSDAVLLDGFDTVRLAGDVLPALEAADVRTEEVGELLDYRDADASVQIEVSAVESEGGTDWFDLGVMITVEGHELPFAVVFAAIAQGHERLLLADGAHFSLQTPELSALRTLIEEARTLGDGGRPGALRLSRYQAGLWHELVGLGVVREQAESWRRQTEALRTLEQPPDLAAPAVLQADLRPYQLDGFHWLAMLWQLGLGGILADDMGLGKTVQALALIAHAIEERAVAGEQITGPACPFIVIAPTSVVPNWVSEAHRFVPSLRVRALTDTLARAQVDLTELVAEADVIVTTYTLARLDAERYVAQDWAAVILDEAQAVKNHNGKTHAVMRRLRAPFKLAITGTPMENNLTELWALLSIVAPGLFPDPGAFTDHYARPIERHADSERLARLRRGIRPLVQRRTKELVAADLPAKQEQTLEVELDARHRKLYDTHVQRERKRILGLLDDFDANRFTILTAITRMRQLSLHAGLIDDKHRKIRSAKLDALVEQLQDVAGGGHRALVFSQFTGFLALVRERLEQGRIGHCYLDGRTRGREKVIERFKAGADPVFLISLKAGGFGLNLTEADYCFLLDPWWNPAAEAQAIDRTHRIGQTRQVMVYRLVSANTIEQKVLALAERKAALFRGVIDDGEMFSAQVTAADIRGLLG